MFNVAEVGKRISELRKKCNLTQFELADRLGISFQAVSNWERGNSMPDISKLPELAEILNTTIDELVCKSNSALTDITSGKGFEAKQYSADEIGEVASVMKPQQMEKMIDGLSSSFEASDLRPLLPYLDEDYIGTLADKLIDADKDITDLLPHMCEDKVDDIALKCVERGKPIDNLLPFMTEDELGRIAMAEFERGGIKAVSRYLPYMYEDDVQAIAEKVINGGK